MKSLFIKSFLLLALTITLSTSALAEDYTYQVTGPILTITDTSITIQKDKEVWKVSRDGSTKITGDLKVGSRVTIKYHMVADSVTAK